MENVILIKEDGTYVAIGDTNSDLNSFGISLEENDDETIIYNTKKYELLRNL